MNTIHKHNGDIDEVTEWLEDLTTEKNEDGSLVHAIQQFQFISIEYNANVHCVVLCNHSEK